MDRFLLSQILCGLVLAAAAGDGSLVVVKGTATPADLLAMLESGNQQHWLPMRFRMRMVVAGMGDLMTLMSVVQTSSGVIDATFSHLETETVAGVCNSQEVPHLVLGYVYSVNPHKWSFYVNGLQRDIGEAIDAVVAYFGWSRVNVVSDGSLLFGTVPDLLKSSSTRDYIPLDFPSSDPTSVSRTVGQSMRMSGNRINVFLTSPLLSESIISTQYSKQIGGIGFGNILPLFSSVFVLDPAVPSMSTGSIILAEKELASVETQGQYYQAVLASAASLLSSNTDLPALRNGLEDRFPTHVRPAEFLLLNMQAGIRVAVGSVNLGLVRLPGTVYFLGNTTEVPKNAKSPLKISGNFGTRNVASVSTTVHYYYYGGLLAVDQINTWPNLLENFHLEFFNFTAGVSVWNYDFAYKNIFPNLDKLGLALLSGTSSGVTIKLISFLKGLNYSGPILGSSNTVDSLSSRKDYPTFVRTVLADNFITGVYLQMFKRFNWKNCGLFVSNETWGLGFQSAFSKLAHDNGIAILNDPKLQILPTPLSSVDQLRNYTANFVDFIETKARILIIVVNSNAIFLIDYLYELGMRAGDLQIVANEWMAMNLVQTNDTETNRKRSEILRGAIQFSPVAFIGPFGAQVKSDYIQRYLASPPVYSCFFYDSVLSIAYALDLVIRTGGDYTSPSVLLKALRGSRFVGCTGTVTFDPETNDRSPMQYNVLNAQFGDNDTYITNVTTVAVYDPTSTIVFKFYRDLIWCDGTTTIPADIRKSTIGCPFEDKFNQQFQKGKDLLYGVCAGIACLTAALTFVIWKVWWTRPLQRLTEKREITVADVILMAGLVIELIQYISMGPDLKYISSAVLSMMTSTTLDIEQYITYKDGGYGLVWLGVTVTVACWVLMCLIVFFHLDYRLECIPCCRSIGDISESLIPIIGNLFFLPIVSILMDVFACVNGVGISVESVSFADSYLYKDCYLGCWRGVHQIYVIGSSVALVVYLPAAVLLRPMWQELQEQLNIKTSPLFLMVKTVVQIALIVLNKTVKPGYQLGHAVGFLGVMAGFAAFSVRVQCFGYKRTALWHIVSLMAVCWSTLLAVIYETAGSKSYVLFMGLLAGGWSSLALAGVIYQVLRVPSLLYRKPGVDSASLFKFAFKRATTEILTALKDNFEKVGHRSRVIVQRTPTESARRYIAATEDLSAERNLHTSPRVHFPIQTGHR